MDSLTILSIVIILYIAAYYLYASYISKNILGLNKDKKTPAHIYNDNIDYVPTKKSVLFGHHYASIAGLSPMLGPAIAVVWGWLPAVLWVLFGSIFIGAVHDFTTLSCSMRHKGRSIGDIVGTIINPRARLLFLVLIFFMLTLAMGVFAYVIAVLFTSKFHPEAVIPTFSLILIAVVIGFIVQKGYTTLKKATIIGLLLMMIMIGIGIRFPLVMNSVNTWIYILLFYSFIASVLPVWLLLQPRDYLNSFQLYIGMIAMIIGIVILKPQIVAPAINTTATDLPPIYPFLFITIACGAISGFHSIVSSGTTVKQINKETDAKVIGYGGMLGEGLLATLAIIACTARFSSPEEWHSNYGSWKAIQGLGFSLDSFIKGAGLFVSQVGIPEQFAVTLISVVVVGYAMTTLDSATRLLRYNIEEMGAVFNIKPLSNRYLSSLLAVLAIGNFALLKIGGKPAGIALWKLFGTSNQILAALGLLMVGVYLFKQKKPTLFVNIPIVIMMIISITAMTINLKEFYLQESWMLFNTGLILLIMSVWLVFEAIIAYRQPPTNTVYSEDLNPSSLE